MRHPLALKRTGSMTAERGKGGFEREIQFLQKLESRFLIVRNVLRDADHHTGKRAHFHHVAAPARALDPGVLAVRSEPVELRFRTVASRREFVVLVSNAVPRMQTLVGFRILVPGVVNKFLNLFGIARVNIKDFIEVAVEDGAAGNLD